MDKIWKIAPRKFDDLIDQLLYNRGIIKAEGDEEEKLKFFRPNFDTDLPDPFLMKNLKEAVERIKEAIEKDEKIGIFADYDADGIPGAALLYKALTKIGLECHVYIPNRESGYGLSREGINLLIEKKCSLIITVDLGIRNFDEANYCHERDIDLIITDHHLPAEEIPKADLVINPKQEGDRYPYKELSGCGVAFKLVQGLSHFYPKEIDEKFLKWNLDLVAISTISDVVPLSGENRILSKYGLIVLKKTKNTGLKAMLNMSGIKDETIGAYTVGFQIGPRINAPGRMDSATKSFELLVTDDATEANELANWLNEKNELRQKAMDAAEKDAVLLIEKNNLVQHKILIIAGDWQKGVIGPTASRIVEKYNRPVILFATDKDSYVGSARSVKSVNIVDLLTAVKSLLAKFGGHAGAAGVSVAKSEFLNFTKSIIKVSDQKIQKNDLIKEISIDADIDKESLTIQTYEKLIKFEPFGMSNPRPVFLATNVSFESWRFVGKSQNHLSVYALVDGKKLKSVYFNFPFERSMINSSSNFDIVFTLGLDEWNGRNQLSLNIIDLRKNET